MILDTILFKKIPEGISECFKFSEEVTETIDGGSI